MKKTKADQLKSLRKQLEAAQRSIEFWEAHKVQPLANRYRRRAAKLAKLISSLGNPTKPNLNIEYEDGD